jgi:hypothetical protein
VAVPVRKEHYLLAYDALQYGRDIPTFRKKYLSSSSVISLSLLHTGYLPFLIFDPADGGNNFRNIDVLLPDYSALYPRYIFEKSHEKKMPVYPVHTYFVIYFIYRGDIG